MAAQAEVISPVELTETSTARRDRWIYRIAGCSSILGAVGIGAGFFLPWADRATTTDILLRGEVAKGSWFGLLLAIAALFLVVAGVLVLLHPFRPNLVMPLLPTMATGLAVADVWTTVTAAGTHIASGCLYCLIGIGLGAVATVVMVPAEHADSK